MSRPDRELADSRAARDRARAEFDRRLALAKGDLAPAVLKRRVAAEAQRTALSVARQAIDIANDGRGVVAATLAAVALWVARKPILATAAPLLRRLRIRKAAPSSAADRFKLMMDDYWRRLKEYADE